MPDTNKGNLNQSIRLPIKETYILGVWPNSKTIEALIARKGHNGHDHCQPGSVFIQLLVMYFVTH